MSTDTAPAVESTPKMEYDPATQMEEAGYDPQSVAGPSEIPFQGEFYSGSDDADPSETDAPVPEAEKAVEGEKSVEDEADQKAPAAEKPLSRTDWAECGLSEDQARAFDNGGQLDEVLDLIVKRTMVAGQETSPAVPAEASPASSLEETPGPLELRTKAEDYGEELLADFTAANRVLGTQAAELKALRAEVAQMAEASETRRAGEETAWFDEFFAAMPEEYAEYVGRGNIQDLSPQSDEFAFRSRLVDAVGVLRAGYERTGNPVPARKVLAEQAARLALGDRVQEVARKQVAKQVRNAQGQFVAKPTHRQGKPPSPDEAAARFSENFYKKKGL